MEEAVPGPCRYGARDRAWVWRLFPALRRQAPIAALAAFLVVLVPGSAASEPLREIRRVVSSSDPAWTVHWQARISERGGQFRLYRGADPDNLVIVDIQQAAAGLNSYRFDDQPDGLARRYYQLRYVGSAGQEVVLARLRVDRTGLEPAPGTVLELAGPGAKALAEAAEPWSASFRRRPVRTEGTRSSGHPPLPEVPPPRGLEAPNVWPCARVSGVRT